MGARVPAFSRLVTVAPGANGGVAGYDTADVLGATATILVPRARLRVACVLGSVEARWGPARQSHRDGHRREHRVPGRCSSAHSHLGGPALVRADAPSIFANVVMATSVHIPKVLLDAVDRRAQALRISRNRLILKALERELQEDPGWSAGFFERLASPDAALAGAAEEMLDHIRRNRRSKKALRL